MVKDPVCGMEVDPETTKYQSEYKGEIYYFCSERCKKGFERKPERFVET